MEWILVIIVVFAIYNAERLPDIIKRLKKEVPHIADAGKKAAQELKEKRGLKHCLVLCGINTLKTNWEKEILKHSDLSCTILGKRISKKGKIIFGGLDARLKQLNSEIEEFFVITNIETIRDDRVVKAILNGPNEFDMIVLDEAHVCKNSSSHQGENLLKLNKATYRIPATGTLLLNQPLDTFVPLKWVDADRSTKTNFENYYCVKGGQFGNDLIGYRNLDTLKTQLELYSLRRHKDLLDLPPKTVIEEFVDMNDNHKKFYDDITEGIGTLLLNHSGFFEYENKRFGFLIRKG